LGEEIAGVAAAPGVVIGPARVITDPSDPRGFEPGEVLVAAITDPAWTPLFLSAGAVVVEIGAPMSHAMIVCRELGVPCVTGVLGASRRFKDGMLLEVNGGTGTVTVLDDN
jgi:pyruvate,water dikinase